MTSLRIGMYTLAFFVALAIAPMIVRAEADPPAQTAKEVPQGGRQRLNPRPVAEDSATSALGGVPGHDNAALPPSSQQGFGPISGSPLFGGPLK
jgi:hypothetical protein